MAIVTVTNIGPTDPIVVEGYVSVSPGETLSFYRRPAEIDLMISIINAKYAGLASVTITYTAAEQAWLAWAAQQATTSPVTLPDGATVTIDISQGTLFSVTTAASRNLALSNPKDGAKFLLAHTASGGAYTLSPSADFLFGSDIVALSATANGRTDIIGFVYMASLGKALVVSYVKGF